MRNYRANSDSSDANWCYNFKQNLWLGKKGRLVEALQIALSKEGFFDTSLIKNPWAFGVSTKVAVTKFQKKYNIKTTGTVGPATNDKLNELYGCKTTTQPSITVTSPNGGETWQIGKTYDITWKATNVINPNIYLNFVNGAMCLLKTIPQDQVVSGKYSYLITESQYCPNSGKTVTIIPDKYKIVIYGDTESVRDSSDNYFNIVSGVTSSNTAIFSDSLLASISDAISKIAEAIKSLAGR